MAWLTSPKLDLWVRIPGMGIAPGLWLPTANSTLPTIYADFTTETTTGHYWASGARANFASWVSGFSGTFARGSTAWFFNSSGNLASASSNVARFDYGLGSTTIKGLLIEGTQTNVVLWCRDLTNGAWTKTSTTAALDQVGIDGAANSASSLTATALNGTCLQSITLASSGRFQSAYVKRITGTGEIDMTMDNGVTWTNITASVGASWARATIPTQTLANPTVGFRIVTSGDKIAVDVVQNENRTTAASSPILTTTTAVARSADQLSGVTTTTTATSFATTADIVGDDAGFPRLVGSSAGNVNSIGVDVPGDSHSNNFNGAAALFTANTANRTSADKFCSSWDGTGRSLCLNNGTVATDANTMPGGTTYFFGSDGGTSQFLYGHFTQIAIWNSIRATNSELQRLTT